jgi:hypothetical protein
VKVLIAMAQFGLGGTESYSATVAEQLERMGHPTTLDAPNATDEGRQLAAERGLRLRVADMATLADAEEADAAIVQDAGSAYALAPRGIPQVFVTHGLVPFEHPAQALDPAPPVVVLNDRTGRRAAATGSRPEVVRMRQPIDIERFRPRSPARQKPRRVLVFSNYLDDNRMAIVQGACEKLGLELAQRGVKSEPTLDPREEIAEADIVVGYGRSVLEGMAMGRAAYVWDRGGGDGWVTPETYEALESDGFSGAATDGVIDAERMAADFAAYRPELGTLSYDLVRQHHSAAKHADALVPLLDRTEAPATQGDLEALSLLVRAEARAANRAAQYEAELWRAAERTERFRLMADAEREERERVEGHLETVMNSTSWRLTSSLARAFSRLRRRS